MDQLADDLLDSSPCRWEVCRGLILCKAQNEIQDPAMPERLVKDLIDSENASCPG